MPEHDDRPQGNDADSDSKKEEQKESPDSQETEEKQEEVEKSDEQQEAEPKEGEKQEKRENGSGNGEHKKPSLINNWISHLGFYVVAVAIMLLITYALFVEFVGEATQYANIIGLLVLPGVLVFGMVIVPVGMLINYLWRRHSRKQGRETSLPRVDLNDKRTRTALLIFAAASFFLVLPTLAVSTYEGYQYTESVAFCTQICHKVMQPQAVAHDRSSHARVSCADCHIGPGAKWFVKSKLSGIHQVFAVIFDTYQRPIPNAITQLRPARETCEQCHWPARFFGPAYREFVHYTPDEHNTRHIVKMFVHVGGEEGTSKVTSGIHAEMLLDARVEYVATDPHLQHIPWVRYVPNSGEPRIYRSDGKPIDAPRPKGIYRTVDCMDCHNRGAHHFRPPQAVLSGYLNEGRIDASLPYVKRQAADLLIKKYPDRDTAAKRIPDEMNKYYQENYPDDWKKRPDAIKTAGEAVVEIYLGNFFPAMKEDWETYPENVGHMYSAGCFRCHDGLHVDAAGVPISSDCDTCHTFLDPVDGHPDSMAPGAFHHALSLTQHQHLRCNQCHTGGRLLLCADCHKEMMKEGEWKTGEFRRTGNENDSNNPVSENDSNNP